MKKKIAIKGHPTRGKEVIELLEMMGGNTFNSCMEIAYSNRVYYIGNNNAITWDYIGHEEIDKYKIFTLEEFLEKYPFKVGDLKDRKVDNISCIIDKMRWNSKKECIEYHGSFGKNDYGWHRAEDFRIYDSFPNIFSQKFKTAEISFNEKVCNPEVELKLGNYEIIVRDNRTFAVLKKPKYPTTYDDCCDMLNADEFVGYELMTNFPKLINARNAYWKIAGEQMGLNKSWESPLPSLFETVYCIRRKNNEIIKGSYRGGKSEILEFPTEEMRDAFYENFKELIEQCKELL